MILLPFDPRLADLIVPYYSDPAYAHWGRGVTRYLTVEECSRLPQIMGAEFLHIVSEGKAIGLVKVREESAEVFSIGLVIDKDAHGRGLSHQAVKVWEEYARNVKRARLAVAQTVTDWSSKILEKAGWVKAGEIPEHFYLDGKYVSSWFYYKKLR